MLVAVCVTLHSHFLLTDLSHPAPAPLGASSASQLLSGTTDGEDTVASHHLRGSTRLRPPRHIAHRTLAYLLLRSDAIPAAFAQDLHNLDFASCSSLITV